MFKISAWFWVVVLVVFCYIAAIVAPGLFSPEATGGLSVGSTAPDFSAVAADGQVVRLSDLRGKVVVLDFWATWCPPCRAMIPHERSMVKKLQGKPFAFVGISADHDVTELRQFLAAQRIAWPNIFDGANGSLQRQYAIQHYPTIYVLDAAGIIRFKEVRGAELERAVEGLLSAGH